MKHSKNALKACVAMALGASFLSPSLFAASFTDCVGTGCTITPVNDVIAVDFRNVDILGIPEAALGSAPVPKSQLDALLAAAIEEAVAKAVAEADTLIATKIEGLGPAAPEEGEGANATVGYVNEKFTALDEKVTDLGVRVDPALVRIDGIDARVTEATRAVATLSTQQGMGGGVSSSSDAQAFGTGARATASRSQAIGTDAQASATGAVAVGSGSRASGVAAVALGEGSVSTGRSSIAVGARSEASGENSVAMGDEALASGDNSVALGSGSVARADNEVSVGNETTKRRLTNLAPGVDVDDAVTVGQAQELMGQFDYRLDEIQTHASQGIASLAAIQSVAPSRAGNTAVGVGVGNYGSETALGLSISHALNVSSLEFAPVINLGVGYAGDGDPVIRAGFQFEF